MIYTSGAELQLITSFKQQLLNQSRLYANLSIKLINQNQSRL